MMKADLAHALYVLGGLLFWGGWLAFLPVGLLIEVVGPSRAKDWILFPIGLIFAGAVIQRIMEGEPGPSR